jgi:ParB/RepB/Spo0J family partition protein
MKSIDSLAALMDEADKAGQQTGSAELPIAMIQRDQAQPRRTFDEAKLKDLAASITAQGIVQPVVVRPDPDDGERYILIAGERRWRAAQIAGLDTIPAVVRSPDSPDILAIQLIENINRENVAILEEAEAVARLVDELGKAALAAKSLGKPAAWVSQRRKIAKGLYLVQPVVDSGATRDPETLTMLIDLAKADEARFETFLRKTQIARGDVRQALDVAKGKKTEGEAGQGSDAGQAESTGNAEGGGALLDKAGDEDAAAPSAKPDADGGAGDGEKVSHVKLSVEDDAPKAGEGGKSDRLDGIAADLTDLLKVAVKIRLSGDDRGELRIPFDSRETLESVLAHIRR